MAANNTPVIIVDEQPPYKHVLSPLITPTTEPLPFYYPRDLMKQFYTATRPSYDVEDFDRDEVLKEWMKRHHRVRIESGLVYMCLRCKIFYPLKEFETKYGVPIHFCNSCVPDVQAMRKILVYYK